jgi:hypothetical protein
MSAADGFVYDYRGTPARYRGEGFLYVIGFTPTRIKVGRTNQPNARISTHIRYGRGILGTDPQVWVSGPHSDYKANERALLEWCRAKANAEDRSEWFDLGFNKVVRVAEALAA